MPSHPFTRALAVMLTLALLALPGSPALAQRGDGPVIAAASDLQFALRALADTFTEETGKPLRLSFGSSGNIARQIRQGAPFEMFLSADQRFVEMLVEAGHTVDEGALYAVGRVAVAAPPASPISVDARLEGLRTALAEGTVRRFAIANPEHAPYGMRAEEALRHAGLWEDLQPYLILGENVSQAAQFAASGSAEGGIVAYSLVRSAEMGARVEYALIPRDWHRPLRQRMVLIQGAGETARAFYGYLQSADAREILEAYGFALPE